MWQTFASVGVSSDVKKNKQTKEEKENKKKSETPKEKHILSIAKVYSFPIQYLLHISILTVNIWNEHGVTTFSGCIKQERCLI